MKRLSDSNTRSLYLAPFNVRLTTKQVSSDPIFSSVCVNTEVLRTAEGHGWTDGGNVSVV